MSSDNPSGADNQQETRLAAIDPWWVVGFVDGEGCFSVSIHQNDLAKPTNGWHIQPSFQISQHGDHEDVLEALVRHFGVGKVREKGIESSVKVYVVHSTKQLCTSILPYFERYPLRVKQDDFESFAWITRAVRRRAHHDRGVFEECVRLAYDMNGRGRQRKRPIEEILGSSETAR